MTNGIAEILNFNTLLNILKLKLSDDPKNQKLCIRICKNNGINYDILLQEIDFIIVPLTKEQLQKLKEFLTQFQYRNEQILFIINELLNGRNILDEY